MVNTSTSEPTSSSLEEGEEVEETFSPNPPATEVIVAKVHNQPSFITSGGIFQSKAAINLNFGVSLNPSATPFNPKQQVALPEANVTTTEFRIPTIPSISQSVKNSSEVVAQGTIRVTNTTYFIFKIEL